MHHHIENESSVFSILFRVVLSSFVFCCFVFSLLLHVLFSLSAFFLCLSCPSRSLFPLIIRFELLDEAVQLESQGNTASFFGFDFVFRS